MLSPYWRSGTSPSSTDNTGTEDTTETDSHTVDTGDREGSEYHGQAQHMWVQSDWPWPYIRYTLNICSLSGLIPNILSLMSTQISFCIIWQMPGDVNKIFTLVISSTGEDKRKKMSWLAAWQIWYPPRGTFAVISATAAIPPMSFFPNIYKITLDTNFIISGLGLGRFYSRSVEHHSHNTTLYTIAQCKGFFQKPRDLRCQRKKTFL